MLHKKLTPNEVAKLEIYDKASLAFYCGLSEEYPNATEREVAAVYNGVNKQLERLYKVLGMEKIYNKMDQC
jgi:hypothetical protein